MVIRYFLTLSLLALCLSNSAYALTKLETSVDRNPAIEGEYLVLTIKADDDVDNGSLDTSGLLKDFIVGRTSVSRSTQIMNFDASKETRWQILLAPKKTGTVTIPSLTIDNISSAPIALQVAASGSQPEQMKNLFIRSSLSSEEAYVGQLITYKVKLYLAVELQRGVLSAPNVEGAQLKQLGEDSDTTEILDGRRYRVIERTYSIIADKPGTLSLSGASFSGDVLVEASRRGGMFSFNESRPMQAKAAPNEITILPVPESFRGKWLVSDLVVLKEDWPENNATANSNGNSKEESIEVGTPITRNISLLASNTDDASLPEITLPVPDSFKSYPEKPQRQTFVREKQVVSQLTQTTAIVPTKAGTYTLPEISIPWWNSRTKKQEFATLPARTVTVVASASTPTNSALSSPTAPTDMTNSSAGVWPYLTALFALLWLATLILWRKQYNASAAIVAEPKANLDSKPAKMNGLAQLESVCKTAEAGPIILALQAYFSEQYGKPMVLNDIASLTSALSKAVNDLQRSAYGQNKLSLDPVALMTAVKQAPLIHEQTAKSALAPLNPNE
ncbi:BatD family protein [Shewanella psychrotolerans]|uniref:BatD family protein n=1 Tax=Shewanella psychrotolerans TaxID=2864206 RepID=UPI001C65C91D|nr:BatD family protein [Shewanella psychrotolerans]QYK02689.1 BatD family protein [Shewanella psychrotolerans]